MRPAASSIGSWVTNASQRVAGGDASGSETGAFERAIASHHVALAGGGVYQGGLRGARTRRARTTGGAPGPRPASATETRVRIAPLLWERRLLVAQRRVALEGAFTPNRCPGRNQHGRRRYQRERPSRRLLRRPAIAGEATAIALIRVRPAGHETRDRRVRRACESRDAPRDGDCYRLRHSMKTPTTTHRLAASRRSVRTLATCARRTPAATPTSSRAVIHAATPKSIRP